MFRPRKSKLAEKLVQRIHIETLHAGINLSMATVREQALQVVCSNCHRCKTFCATVITKPVPGQLPEECTTVEGAFKVIGTDFADPNR